MYTDEDLKVIDGKLRKNWLVLGPILAAILAGYVYALKAGVQWLAMTLGPLLFVAACYGLLAYIIPNSRYKGFLIDMEQGLSRDMKGTIVDIAAQAEPQDGAMVLPVRVRLDDDDPQLHAVPGSSAQSRRLGLEDGEDTQNERIVYLNATKRQGFPEPGARVLLHCYGRHIKDVETETAA